MTIVAIVLAAAVASALALIAWLVYRVVAASEQSADARVAQVATEAATERAGYELEVTQKALIAAGKRADALEEVIVDEINSTANPDLASTDVRSRLLQIAGKWREAAAARDPLPPEFDGPMPEAPANPGPDPADVRPVDAPDL